MPVADPNQPLLSPSAASPLQALPALPMAYHTALKAWFSGSVLEAGFKMITQGTLRHLLLYRQAGGALFSDDITATVRMARGRGRKTWLFRDGWCSQCLGREQSIRCPHVAALALSCLVEEEEWLRPAAMAFADSKWQVIGKWLCSHARPGQEGLLVEAGDTGYILRAGADNPPLLRVRLSEAAAMELAMLHPRLLALDHPPAQALARLRDRLRQAEATDNEQTMNEHGMSSKRQVMDGSLWMDLARLFFLQVPAGELSLEQQGEENFLLTLAGAKREMLRLVPPRQHTWELLQGIDLTHDNAPGQSVASQFSEVRLQDDGSIRVVHLCRLANGREIALAELDQYRYGTRYLVDGHFVSLENVPLEQRIREGHPRQASLFDLAGPGDGADHGAGFTVPPERIEEFLAANRVSLRLERHRVDSEILEMRIVDRPRRLLVDSMEVDDDWCYLAGWYDLGNRRIRLQDLLQASEQGKKMLPGATSLRLADSPLAWFHQLGRERILPAEGDGPARIRLRRDELLLLGAQVQTVLEKQQRQASDILAGMDDAAVPSGERMPEHLRDYQRHGVRWLYHLGRYRLGGILADDMGLGKTHQALALVRLLAEEDSESRFLIVCPASVLYHWPEKQQAFFPGLEMLVHHGQGRDATLLQSARLVVTTYGVLRSDADLLTDISFRLVLFDEMQHLKNRNTAVFQAAARLRAEAVIGLTGTPVENNVRELEHLLRLCLPALFRQPGLRQRFRLVESREERQELARIVSPFILRRTRQQVLGELPERSEDILLCQLSDDQVAAYRQVVEQARGLVDELLAGEALEDYSHILTTITRLKQICNHLCQLKGCTDWDRYRSGKWDEFRNLLGQCLQAGLKVVVFSQFTTMLDIMEAWLADQGTGHIAIRGSVPARERNSRIRAFNSREELRVCCASLLAGGTGIDLTGAQVVIHYDRWWNPAREEQATARVHRMGQKRPVQVYRLITEGTLEEKIHRIIEEKKILAADLIQEDDGSILKRLSREHLARLLRFD